MYQVTQLPALSILLDEQPSDLKRAAKHVGLSVKTLQRYRDADAAPRAVMLALFYESKYGYSVLHTTAFNAQRIYSALADSYKSQNDALQLRIEALQRLGNFGSANDPFPHPARLARADDVIYTGPRRAVKRF